MIILTLRTDKPQAEVGLYEDDEQLGYIVWTAHRQLAETIHQKIETLLKDHGYKWTDIAAVAYYKGPGSFTGLRIGAALANALALANNIPVISQNNDDWIANSIQALSQDTHEMALPYYGSEPHITSPKK